MSHILRWGTEAYQSPEFKAFALYLGIPHELLTTDITITIPLEGAVRIAHDYNGQERHLPRTEELTGIKASDEPNHKT